MSLKFLRQKDRHFLLSLAYKLDKIIPVSKKRKLKLYLDLEWIFERLAHEHSFSVFSVHPVRLKAFAFLRSHLTVNDRILDVGCGTGALSNQISDHVKFIAAIDHNPDLIGRAKSDYSKPNLVFQTADALEYLSSSNDPFDVLILSHVLEHLEDPAEFLGAFVSKFKRVYIEVPDLERTQLNEYRQELNSKLQYSDNDHIWEFTRNDVYELISSCGLKVLDMEFRFGVQKYWCACPSANNHIA